MTVTTQFAEPRWGVWFRKNPREPWTLLVSSGDRQAAERLLIDMASSAKQSGDWCVRRTDSPPTPIARQRRS